MEGIRSGILIAGFATLVAGTFSGFLAGCSRPREPVEQVPEDVLIMAAYTVPKDVYQERIIPQFQKIWKDRTGHNLRIEQSYAGSGAQARAIAGGFEADIAALSLEGDIDRIAEAGLLSPDWKTRPGGPFITRSVVVIGVREGNPLNIRDWSDLTGETVELICPNPKTSGGAQWCINAIVAAGMSAPGGSREAAHDLLKSIVRRIKVMDKGARGSMTTYEQGIGNAILTYENEALLRIRQGKPFPYIVPPTTMLIENPVAVVTANAEKHGVSDLAEAFVTYLYSLEAQRAFAEYGFRPVHAQIMAEFAGQYPIPEHLRTVDDLGGWDRIGTDIYGIDGLWPLVNQEIWKEK